MASVIIPEIGEEYELVAGAPARRLRTGRVELQEALSGDWQNAYADFAVNLKPRLKRISDAAQRARAIAEMQRVLEATLRTSTE